VEVRQGVFEGVIDISDIDVVFFSFCAELLLMGDSVVDVVEELARQS